MRAFFFLWIMALLGLCPMLSHGAEVTIEWSPCDIANHYRVAWGAVSGTYTETSPDIPQPPSGTGTMSHTVSGLSEGSTYYFAVESFNEGGASSGYSDEATITVGSSQTNLFANAGPDQEHSETTDNAPTQIQLDGTESTETDGTISAYFWTRVDGQEAIETILTSPTSATPSFNAPSISGDTTLEFELTVTGSQSTTATDTVLVTITNVNQSPGANAGPDQFPFETTLGVPTTVTLNGTDSSDPDGSIATYAWARIDTNTGTAITLQNSGTASPTFVAPDVISDTALVFELTVTDNEGATATDTTLITLKNVNRPPTADAGPDQSKPETTEGDPTTITLSGTDSSDSDGSISNYAWTRTDTHTGTVTNLQNSGTATPSFLAPAVTTDLTLACALTVTDNQNATDTDTVLVAITNVNQAPVANAGNDRSLPETSNGNPTPVTLSGTGSSDPDGSIAHYSWTRTDANTEAVISLQNPETASPTFLAPSVTTATTLSFELTVTDNEGLTASDTVLLTFTNVNRPPIADAGPDQAIPESPGTTVATLTGVGSSDPDGTIAQYAWARIDTNTGVSLTLQNPNTATPTFATPMVATDTTFEFELTVTDNENVTATDRVLLTVENVNQPPTADAGGNQSHPETTDDNPTLITLNGNASSDPDGSITQYSWSRSDGQSDITTVLVNPYTATPTFYAPDISDDVTLTFELTVTDNENTTATDLVEVFLGRVNQTPIANAGPNQTVSEQSTVTLSGANSMDPDGTIVSWAWQQLINSALPPFDLSGASTPTATFEAPDVGLQGASFIFLLTVVDDSGASHASTTIINVTFSNQPPVAQAGPDQTVLEGTPITLSGDNSTDPDNEPIDQWAWEQLSGPTVLLTDEGSPSATFTAPDVGADGEALTFKLTTTDSGGLSDSDEVIVNVTFDNQPPVAETGPNQTVSEGDTVTLSATHSLDPDDGIASYRWSQTEGSPIALSDATAVSPSFTAPAVSIDGTQLTFMVTVTDEGGLTGTDTVLVNITNLNQPPVASAGSNITASEAEVVTLSGSDSQDPDGTIASYLWIQKTGPSVTLSDASAEAPAFTTPEVDMAGASLGFELKVTDNEGLSATAEVLVAVTHTNRPPEAIAGVDFSADEGTTVTLSGSASSDPDDGIASYQWQQIAGPTVLFSNPDSAVTTFPAPDVSQSGADVTFRLTVSDNSGISSSDEITVAIAYVNVPPIAMAGPDQQVDEGLVVTLTAEGSHDPENAPIGYQWEQMEGPAVAISDANSASATFTAPDIQSLGATLIFQLTVTDDEGLTATDLCTVQALFVNEPPIAHAGGDQSVQEGTTVTLDASASEDLDDGISSWAWTQVAGPPVTLSPQGEAIAYFVAPKTLPGGIELTFSLTVTDNHGLDHSDTCTVKDTFAQALQIDETATVSIEIVGENMEHRDWISVGWEDYRALNNETRLAAGDLDGDGNDELIIGLAPVGNDSAIPGGYFQILAHDYTHLAWGKIPWEAYNDLNGETWPTCGDLDGDGRDEIIVGLGKGGQGKLAIFSYGDGNVTLQQWAALPWDYYNETIGETHPACGNFDDDPCLEIVVGLGSDGENTTTKNGHYAILDRDCSDDQAPFILSAWERVNWSEYNALNGATWPSCGDTDDDGKDEIFLGMGKGGGGRTEVVGFTEGVLEHLNWISVDWPEYNDENGETRPTCADIDGDGALEIVIGLGPVPGNDAMPGGRMPVLNADQSLNQWGQLGETTLRQSSGESRPTAFKTQNENLLAIGLGPLPSEEEPPTDPPDGDDPTLPNDPTAPSGCFINTCR